MTEEKKKVLHVGCGVSPLPDMFPKVEWQETRLDSNAENKPDIIAEMFDLKTVADASYHAVYTAHSLECLYAHQVPAALKEWRRVLQENGFLFLSTPDIQQAAQEIVKGNHEPLYQSNAGPVHAIDILYGFRPALAAGFGHMQHRTGFTPELLGRALANVGFSDVTVSIGDWQISAVGYNKPIQPGDEVKIEIIDQRKAKEETPAGS